MCPLHVGAGRAGMGPGGSPAADAGIPTRGGWGAEVEVQVLRRRSGTGFLLPRGALALEWGGPGASLSCRGCAPTLLPRARPVGATGLEPMTCWL